MVRGGEESRGPGERSAERPEALPQPGREARHPVTYCIVPPELAAGLHDALRRHFRDDPSVEVVVERRHREQRVREDRRALASPREWPEAPSGEERREVRSPTGRRMGERRAALLPVEAPELPRKARRHAERLRFARRLEPPTEQLEDQDTARLIARIQAGDREAYGDLYLRYFDRVFAYLKVALRNVEEAEDAAQEVFTDLLEALPRYERRRPFGAWLFTIVRNRAISELRRLGRLEVMDPAELDNHREAAAAEEETEVEPEEDLFALNWIVDRDLLLFVERLPLPQRQVLVLRYLIGLAPREIAKTLNLTPNRVSVLQYRALGFLRERLTALGREPKSGRRAPIRRTTSQARVLRNRRFALDP